MMLIIIITKGINHAGRIIRRWKDRGKDRGKERNRRRKEELVSIINIIIIVLIRLSAVLTLSSDR